MRSESWGSEPGPLGRESSLDARLLLLPLSCGSVCPDQLKSNSPRLMDEAVLALRNLARQCSDSTATEALTKHLFAILGGEREGAQEETEVGTAVGWELDPELAPGEAVAKGTSLHM